MSVGEVGDARSREEWVSWDWRPTEWIGLREVRMFRNLLQPQHHHLETLLMFVLYAALVLYLVLFGARAAGAPL